MQEIVDRLTADDRGAQIARTLVYPYLNHAATMYESGYATKDDIDASMRFGCGYPVGPLALVDALGASTVVEGLRAQHATTGDPLHEPAPVLVKLAEAGETFESAASDAGATPAPQKHHPVGKVGVVGTGTMAAGIVEVFAKAGHDVVFVGRSDDKVAADLHEQRLQKAPAEVTSDPTACGLHQDLSLLVGNPASPAAG